MGKLNLATAVLLPGLLATAVLTVMVMSFNNGMFPGITAIIEDESLALLPGTDDAPLTRAWTGIAAIDRQFTVLLIFFWQILDGRSPTAILQGVHFFGQMGSFWTLMQLEAKREGNKGRIIAYTTIFGLLYQNISVAITIPIWTLLHLLSSTPTTSASLTNQLAVSPASARVLPWAMALGYIAPSIAMAVPSPVPLPHLTKQTLITLWQVFPLWVTTSTYLLQPLFASSTASPNAKPTPLSSYHASATTHLFALLLSAIPHATALSVSLASLLFPALFSPGTAALFHPRAVFLPRLSPPGTVLASYTDAATGFDDGGLAAGVLRFMQWDEAVSTAAAVTWAVTVYLRDTGVKGGRRWGVVGTVARAVGWSAVVGPAGAAAVVVWGRDEVVLGAEGQVGAKKV